MARNREVMTRIIPWNGDYLIMTWTHIDLCCGLGGWQEPFQESAEWRSIGIDVREDLSPDVVGDVRELPLRATQPELITASPPCTEFSRYDMPWLAEPNPSMELVNACLNTINHVDPEYWVLENVRGLHRYWRPARKRLGAFHLWGYFPPFDAPVTWKGKMQTSGERPEERAKIPYPLADGLRKAVEWYL